MVINLLAKINNALEVRDAMKKAREGVPGAYEEARIMGTLAKYHLINREPNCSEQHIKEYVTGVRYEIHLKTAYSNASDKSIKEAAHNVAILDSRYCTHDSPEHAEAIRSVKRMIEEHKANSKLVASLRK